MSRHRQQTWRTLGSVRRHHGSLAEAKYVSTLVSSITSEEIGFDNLQKFFH